MVESKVVVGWTAKADPRLTAWRGPTVDSKGMARSKVIADQKRWLSGKSKGGSKPRVGWRASEGLSETDGWLEAGNRRLARNLGLG